MYIFDAHCDYLWMKALNEPSALANNTLVQKSALAVFEGSVPDNKLIETQINEFQKEKPVNEAYIAFEGLSWVKSLWDLEDIVKHRPLYVGPVWNRKNEMGGSCYDDAPVTVFGKCFLGEIDNSGIFIDLAHAGEEMFNSCMEEFKNVLFSHGNVFEVHSHPRNLRKKQIKKLIERDSFMGLTLYTGFVGGRDIDQFLKHVNTVLDMGGSDILGIGSDLDGCESLVGTAYGAQVLDEIVEALYRENYGEEVIEKILHLNLERCIKKSVKKIG